MKRILCFLILLLLLCGCRHKVSNVTVFNHLPPSDYLESFSSALDNKMPIAVSFTAEWCPHCKKYKPIFFDAGSVYESKVQFINVDVESSAGKLISERFQVKGVPTTAFIRKDGSVYMIKVGEIEKEELVDITKHLLKSKKRKKDEPVAPFPIEPLVQVDNDTSSKL